MRSVRVFVSSPGDTHFERMRIARVVERLNGEFSGVAMLEAIRWEEKYYQARASFQQQIPEAAECDIVIAILRHRLGTELPDDFPVMPNGERYPSGTAYEILSAIEASKKKSLPDVYVFRYSEPPTVKLDDEATNRLVTEQWSRLKSFFQTWFQTPDGKFKLAFHSFQTTDQFEAEAEKLLRTWLEEKILKGRSVLWPVETKGSPFRGLAAFGPRHAPVFFGRSRDITRGVDAMKDAAARGSPFMLIVGASGSGKSSLALAGLVPRLTTPGVVPSVDIWRVAVMRPSENPAGPVAALAECLFESEAELDDENLGRLPALPELSGHATPAELTSLFAHADETSVRPILKTLDDLAGSEGHRRGHDRPVGVDLLLVVDQLDELFAGSVGEAERARFAKLLAQFVATGRIWVIATLRADLYERFLKEPDLLAMKTKGATYDLAPPGATEIDEIIRGPANAAGLVYETDRATGERLDDRLIRDVDRPDMLPLLQFALDYLFEQRKTENGETHLTFKAYDTLGGLAGAIDQEAERALATLGKEEQDRLPRLLRQLATPAQASEPGGGPGLSIRSVPLSEAAYDPASERLVKALVDARILLSSGSEQNASIRLAHQRVLENWKRARDIVAANAEFYRIRDDVEALRRRWEKSSKQRDLLIPKGVPLAEAESIAKRYPDELGAPTLGFIAASGKRARLKQRLTAATAVVFAILAIAATVLGEMARQAQQRATAEAERAEKNFAVALDSVRTMVFQVAQKLRQIPGVQPETLNNVLEGVRTTIEQLSAEAPENFTLLDSRAAMLDEYTTRNIAAGNYEAARGTAQESLSIARRLAKADESNPDWRFGLWVSLIKLGIVQLGLGETEGALASFEEAHEIIEKFVEGEPQNTRYQNNLASTLANIGDAKSQAKDYAAALSFYDRSLTIRRTLAEQLKDIGSQSDVASDLDKIGFAKRDSGDRPGALAAFGEAVDIWRKLADANPSVDYLQQNLSRGLQHLGDAKVESDPGGALAAYEEGLHFARRLADDNPSDVGLQWNYIDLLDRVAGVKFRDGDYAGALPYYRDQLNLAKWLAGTQPDNSSWQSSLSVALNKLAETKRLLRDSAGALADYEESLSIRRKLPKTDKNAVQWNLDIASNIDKIGDIKLASGDIRGALAAYEELLSIDRQLADADPDNATQQRNLSVTLLRIGDVRVAKGDLKDALADYEESLVIRRKLLEKNKTGAQPATDVSYVLQKIGEVKTKTGDDRGALAAYEESLALDREAAKIEPDKTIWQLVVAESLFTVGDARTRLDDQAGALTAYEECLGERRRLYESDKNNQKLLLGISAALEKIADIKFDSGDKGAAATAYDESLRLRRELAGALEGAGNREGALQAFEASLAIARKLAKAAPDNIDNVFAVTTNLEDVASTKLKLNDSAGALAAYEESLDLRRGLAGKNKEAKWLQYVSDTLQRIGDLKQNNNKDGEGALAAYEEMLANDRRLADAEPENSNLQHYVAQSLERVAKAKLALGDTQGALGLYGEALVIRRRVAEAVPENETYEQALATTLATIGDMKRDSGDPQGALQAYNEMLKLDREIAAAKFGDLSRQRTISADLQMIADVKLKLDDIQGALAAAAESADIAGNISAMAPNNVDWKRDLSARLNSLAEVKKKAGDAQGAADALAQNVQVQKEIAATAPDDLELQRNASIALERLGDQKSSAGDNHGALKAYEEMVSIDRKVAELDSANPVREQELMRSLNKLGDARMSLDDPSGALANFDESVGIARKLLQKDGTNAVYRRDLALSLEKAANARLRLTDPQGALAAVEEAFTLRKALADANQDNYQWRRDLTFTLDQVANAKLALNDSAGAVSAAEEALAIARELAEKQAGNVDAETDVVVGLYRLAKIANGERKEAVIDEGLEILARLDAGGKLTEEQKGWSEYFTALRKGTPQDVQ